MAANLLPQQVIITPLYELYLRIHAARRGCQRQRPRLRLVRRADRDQRRVPDGLLHVRALELHEDDPEVAQRGRARRRRRRDCASSSAIILPLCKPALAALAMLEFTWIYNDFLWAIVLMSSGDKRPITSSLVEPLRAVLHRQQPDRRRVDARRAADDHGLRAPAAPVHQRPHARVDEGVAVTRVAFIGAGSVVFTKNLLGDILALPGAARRRDRAPRHRPRPARDRGGDGPLRRAASAAPRRAICAHLERRAALDGADYVLNMVQIGGHAATLLDFEIPARYGLRQTIADTLGDRRASSARCARRTTCSRSGARWRSSAPARLAAQLHEPDGDALLARLRRHADAERRRPLPLGAVHDRGPRGARRRARRGGRRSSPPGSTTRRSSSASSATARPLSAPRRRASRAIPSSSGACASRSTDGSATSRPSRASMPPSTCRGSCATTRSSSATASRSASTSAAARGTSSSSSA